MVYIDDQPAIFRSRSDADNSLSYVGAETLDNSNTTSSTHNRPNLKPIVISNSFESNGVSMMRVLENSLVVFEPTTLPLSPKGN